MTRYSAIVLDETSSLKLKKWAEKTFPTQISFDRWKVYCHHMTVCMGELPSYLKGDVGKEISLNVTGVGVSDLAIAVRVAGYYTKNKIPHVTLAINTDLGGKPVASNNIHKWYPATGALVGMTLNGTLAEVE